MRDFIILIKSLNIFPKIPKGTCEETSFKLDKLVSFLAKFGFSKKNTEWGDLLPTAGCIILDQMLSSYHGRSCRRKKRWRRIKIMLLLIPDGTLT